MSYPCVVSAGTVLEDFTDYTDWSIDSSTYQYAAVETRISQTIGKLGCKFGLKAAGASTTTYYWTKTISMSLNSYKAGIELRFYAAPIDAGIANNNASCKVAVEFSSTTDFSKSFSFITAAAVHPGWNYLRVAESDWTNTGSESWSNTMLRVRIGLKPTWTGAMSVIYPDELLGGVETTPSIILSVWDNYPITNHLAAIGAMGWKGDICFDFANEGQYGRLTVEQFEEALAAGWSVNDGINQSEVLDPSWSHTAQGYLSVEMLAAIHEYNVAEFDARGWPTPMHSYGTFLNYIEVGDFYKMLSNQGVRTMMREAPTSRYLNAQPIDDRYQLVRYELGSAVTLATAEAQVDACVARGACLIIGVQQLVDSSPGSYDWLTSDYESLLTYIDGEGITPMTMDEWYLFATETGISWRGEGGGSGTPGANSIVLGDLDLNDGVNCFVDNQGVNLGNRQTVWEEVVSYSAEANAQVNVRRGNLIPVTIPLRVHGSTASDLDTKLAALWAEVDKTTNTLTLADESYEIVCSTRPDTIERDPFYVLGHDARFTLVLMRKP